MKSEPVADAGFVAHEQGFENVEPGIGVFDDGAAAVEFGVKKSVIVGLPIGRTAVAGDVGFDVLGGAGLTQLAGIKGAVRT